MCLSQIAFHMTLKDKSCRKSGVCKAQCIEIRRIHPHHHRAVQFVFAKEGIQLHTPVQEGVGAIE